MPASSRCARMDAPTWPSTEFGWRFLVPRLRGLPTGFACFFIVGLHDLERSSLSRCNPRSSISPSHSAVLCTLRGSRPGPAFACPPRLLAIDGHKLRVRSAVAAEFRGEAEGQFNADVEVRHTLPPSAGRAAPVYFAPRDPGRRQVVEPKIKMRTIAP